MTSTTQETSPSWKNPSLNLHYDIHISAKRRMMLEPNYLKRDVNERLVLYKKFMTTDDGQTDDERRKTIKENLIDQQLQQIFEQQTKDKK